MQQSNFDNFSNDWWKDDGPLKLLHSMNETRILFIQERILNRYQNLKSLETIFPKKVCWIWVVEEEFYQSL